MIRNVPENLRKSHLTKRNETGFDTSRRNATVDTAKPQRQIATKEYLNKRYRKRNIDGGLQIQLEEDGDGSIC